MVDYNEVLQRWGRSVLRERGYKVSDKTQVNVELETTWSGGCDTCSFEETVVSITAGRFYVAYDKYSFETLLKELIKFSYENNEE